MRSSILLLPLATVTTAIQIPNLQPFLSALPPSLLEYLPLSLPNATAHDLLKRQNSNTCPQNFNSCANLGAVGLCCSPNAVCSADYAGHVACCPSGAACTGTISGVITSGTVNSNGGLVGVGAAGAAATTSGGSLIGASEATTTTGFQYASSTTGNGLVLASTTSGAETAAATTGTTAANGGFIIDGSSTVATPGGAIKGAQIPIVARAILRAIEYLPI